MKCRCKKVWACSLRCKLTPCGVCNLLYFPYVPVQAPAHQLSVLEILQSFYQMNRNKIKSCTQEQPSELNFRNSNSLMLKMLYLTFFQNHKMKSHSGLNLYSILFDSILFYSVLLYYIYNIIAMTSLPMAPLDLS